MQAVLGLVEGDVTTGTEVHAGGPDA